MSLFEAAAGFLGSERVPRPIARGVVRLAVALLRAHQRRDDRRQAARPSRAPAPAGPLFVVDGYHGGIVFWDWLGLRGGGLWRRYNWPLCVLPAIERALSDERFGVALDFDGATFEWMADRDPRAAEILRGALRAGRLELVNGTYGQPFARVESGESFLRHARLGARATRSALGASPTTFYSQEPAYFPQLPQLLLGLGYTLAVVRTQWAAFGTDPAFDADTVLWEAPDGSALPTVPRYSFQNYARQLERHPGLAAGSLGMGERPDWAPESLAAFEEEARVRGIRHPLVADLKDVNVPDAPLARAVEIARMPNVRITTPGEYARLASPPSTVVRSELRDFPCTLPWGLQAEEVPRAAAEAEAALLAAERLDSVSFSLGGPSHESVIERAWKSLCLAQHHDLYVCGPWRSRAHDGPMSGVAVSYAEAARATVEPVAKEALQRLVEEPGGDVLVFNPSPHPRRDYAEVDVPRTALPAAPDALALCNDAECVPCQLVAGDGGTVRLAFIPRLPAFGVAHYRLVAADSMPRRADAAPSRIVPHPDGSITIRDSAGTLVAEGLYFTCARDGAFHDSRATGCSMRWTVRGPVFGRLEIEGAVCGVAFRQTLTVHDGVQRVDASVVFDFGEVGAYLGPQRSEGAYSIRDGEKLCVALSSMHKRLFCGSPFWIGECTEDRPSSPSWVGMDDGRGAGVALLNRGTRGYCFDGSSGTLRNVLAWGPREWIYASDDSLTRGSSAYTALRGTHAFRYAVVPYGERVQAERSAIDLGLPLQAAWRTGARTALPEPRSMLAVSSDRVVVTALMVRSGAVHARLWNASDDGADTRVLAPSAAGFLDVGLDASGPGTPLPEGRLSMRPWQVRTVRLVRPEVSR